MTKHIHDGKSSESILDSDKIIRELDMKKDDVFLDAGCGNGYFSFKVADLVSKVFAVDNFQSSIFSIKEKNVYNIEPLLSNVNSMYVPDGSVDVLYLANVLHGIIINEEFNDSIVEMVRVLKVGGRFAIVEFKKEESEKGPKFENKLSSEQVEELIIPFGFEKVKVVNVGLMSYLIVFRKIRDI